MRYLIIGLILTTLAACSVPEMRIRDGKLAYEYKQYSKAVPLLKKEISKEESRIAKGKLAFMLAESYKALQQNESAISWYQTAYDYSYGVDALRELAYLEKKSENYQAAMQAFKDLGIEIGSPYEYRKEIQACEFAQKWKAEKRQEYRVTLLPFNTSKADYAPALFPNDNLVFTSDRTGGTGEDVYAWTGNNFSDLYVLDLQSENVTSFSNVLNTKNNEGTATFSGDYTQVFFTRCYGAKKEDAFCKLMTAERSGESWSAARQLPFVEDGVNYMHPVLSKDGKTLYFSSNHPDGYGGYDIYKVEWENGDWGIPQILSGAINTPGNEQFPTIHDDTLYFSSDRHSSMGGLDIFKSYKMGNDAWAPALNLKPPINSGADDFGLVIVDNPSRDGEVLQQGYFSSSRLSGMGNDDIYRFEKIKLPPLPELPPPPEVTEEDYKLILEVYVLEKILENPANPNSRVLGRRPLPVSDLEISYDGRSKTVKTDDEGKYVLELEEETDYDFLASKQDFLRNDGHFSSKGIGRDPNNPVQTYELEIELDRIFFNTEIVLENIYYDFDESFIRDDAKPTLDELADNLNLNPEIRIEMGSHTDCRGNPGYNQNLSQNRAQAAVDYLITKGIDPGRLEARGYGESQLAIECICSRCTEEEHQQNRRTTFKIIQ